MEEEKEVASRVYRSIIEVYIEEDSLGVGCESVFDRKDIGMHINFYIDSATSRVCFYAEGDSSRETYRVVCSILNYEEEFGLIAFQGHGDEIGSKEFYEWDVVEKIREYGGKMRICFDLIDTWEKCTEIEIAKQSHMLPFFESGELGDFLIRTKRKDFKVHKIVLAARSPVFDAMFRSKMKEVKTGMVTIMNVRTVVMEEFLRFMYADVTSKLSEMPCELFVAAHLYDVQDLERLCIAHMSTHICVENVTGILNLCDRYPLEETKEAALKFIKENEKSIAKREEYLAYLMETVKIENVVERLKLAQNYELLELKEYLLEFIANNYEDVIKNKDYREMYFHEGWVKIVLEIDEYIANCSCKKDDKIVVPIVNNSKIFVISCMLLCLVIYFYPL